MTDQELLHILENGGNLPIPYFDDAEIRVDLDIFEPVQMLPVVKNFLTLTPENRQKDARHPLAYCNMLIHMVGEEYIDDFLGGRQPTVDDIWNHTKLLHLSFLKLEAGEYAEKATIFVRISFRVAWDEDHGMEMVWANGNRLVRVSSIDGGVPRKDDQYIFEAFNLPEFCTLPDPD